MGEIILHAILLLEVPLVQSHGIGPALRPDVAEAIRATQFERHQMIEFADLVLV